MAGTNDRVGEKGFGGLDYHEEQSYKLLRLTDSEDQLENLRLECGNAVIHQNLPQVTGKTRRKIRLKRKQRDIRCGNGLTGHPHSNGVVWGSSTGTENVSNSDSENDRGESPLLQLLPCCRCLRAPSYGPQQAYRGRGVRYRGANGKSLPFHQPVVLRHSMIIAIIFIVLSIGLVGLSYFAITLQGQVASLSIQLEPLLQERQEASDSNHKFHAKLAALVTNQTVLVSNISGLNAKLDLLTDQIQQLNSTFTRLSDAIGEASFMKTLPNDFKEFQKEIAGFGSRLTDMESTSQMTEMELKRIFSNLVRRVDSLEGSTTSNVMTKDMKHSVEDIHKLIVNQSSKFEAELVALEGRFLTFGSNVTQQLNELFETSKRNWKLLGEVQNDVKNVSARASSNEINVRSFEDRMTRLETKTGSNNGTND